MDGIYYVKLFKVNNYTIFPNKKLYCLYFSLYPATPFFSNENEE